QFVELLTELLPDRAGGGPRQPGPPVLLFLANVEPVRHRLRRLGPALRVWRASPRGVGWFPTPGAELSRPGPARGGVRPIVRGAHRRARDRAPAGLPAGRGAAGRTVSGRHPLP